MLQQSKYPQKDMPNYYFSQQEMCASQNTPVYIHCKLSNGIMVMTPK